MIIFLLLIVGVVCEWPPNCNVVLEDNSALLSGPSVPSSSCSLDETYDNIFFAKLSVGDSYESFLELDIKSVDNVLLQSIRISDGTVTLNSETFCVCPGQKIWLKVRFQPMMDTRETYMHVDVADMDLSFKRCGSVSIKNAYHQLKLGVEAVTKDGSRQYMHEIRRTQPSVAESESLREVLKRIDLLEEKLRRLSNALSEYIYSHDQLSERTEDQHKSTLQAIAGTHNRIVTRSNAHGIFYIFVVAMVLLCGLGYTRWKHGEEKRFHMP